MKDIIEAWNDLPLLDREGDDIKLLEKKKNQVQEFSLVAKFLTKRALNIEAMAKTFKPIWKARNGFKIQNLGDHKLLSIFDNKHDANRVLNNESWNFDKHLVVLQRYSTYILLQDFSLNETTLWIQVHNIPVSYMNRETTEDICMVARKVICSSGDPDSGGVGFIRVRVTVDVACTFCRGKVVTLESGAKTWVSF